MKNHKKRLLASSLISLSLITVEANASISSGATARAGNVQALGSKNDNSVAQFNASDAYTNSRGSFSGSAQATAQTDYGRAQSSASSQNNGLVAWYDNNGTLGGFDAMSVNANTSSGYYRSLTLYGTGKAVIDYDLTFSLSTVGFGEENNSPNAQVEFGLSSGALNVAGAFYSGVASYPTGTVEGGVSDPGHKHVTKVGDGTFSLHFSNVIDGQIGGRGWGESFQISGVAQNAAYSYDFLISSIQLDPNMKLQDGFGKVLADTTAVPVPAALPLMFSGLGFMLFGSRRSRAALKL